MARIKAPTPQEMYRARKEREEQEKLALLPPGFINHGNTCFMNSVLQGLIATRLLSDLVHFKHIPSTVQHHASTPLISKRSPLLTNGSSLAGQCAHPRVDAMPIGDVFLNVMLKAWDAQQNKRRESQSPKALLGAVGRKYDQYLDFAQQDAHEFLRILLDAMRMEEFDVIKKRQPPPQKKRRRNTITPDDLVPEEDKLISTVDMIFGGRLTSILVCQKCKRVSQTYEDFNDLSLSIKAEDYAKERKRDRLKFLAKKLATPFSPNSNNNASLGEEANAHRASSVPPPPSFLEEPVPVDDPRRRSFDVVAPPPPTSGEDEEYVQVNGTDSGVDEMKTTKKDNWVKLGRRISLTVGLGKSAKERKGRPRERASKEISSAELVALKEGEVSPSTDSIATVSTAPATRNVTPDVSPAIRVSPSPRPSSEEGPFDRPNQRSKSPKPPKPTPAESEYLRKILADVTPTMSHHNPFGIFRPNGANASPSSSSPTWMKTVGQLLTIEECMRMFTAVEILDGENMVGCRRCWKIAHGVYRHRTQEEGDEDEDEDDEEEGEGEEELGPSRLASPPVNGIHGSMSMSMPSVSMYTHSNRSDGGESVSSLPATVSSTKVLPPPLSMDDLDLEGGRHRLRHHSTGPGGLPIPSISTTAPESPSPMTARPNGAFFPTGEDSGPATARPLHPAVVSELKSSLLAAPASRKHVHDVDTTDDSSGDESDVSATTSICSVESSTTSIASTSQQTHEETPKAKLKVAKKPKPVMMRPAYKRYLIGTPPPVLVIHLKRFQQISKSAMMSFSTGFKKLEDYVTFPEYLDLDPFLAPKKEDFGLGSKGKKKRKKAGSKAEDEKCMYRLYAVVVHIGNMLGGHYIAYVALPPSDEAASTASVSSSGEPAEYPDRQWAFISDTDVRLTTREEVLKVKAYICMYERM